MCQNISLMSTHVTRTHAAIHSVSHSPNHTAIQSVSQSPRAVVSANKSDFCSSFSIIPRIYSVSDMRQYVVASLSVCPFACLSTSTLTDCLSASQPSYHPFREQRWSKAFVYSQFNNNNNTKHQNICIGIVK